jgi:hypothetical protein
VTVSFHPNREHSAYHYTKTPRHELIEAVLSWDNCPPTGSAIPAPRDLSLESRRLPFPGTGPFKHIAPGDYSWSDRALWLRLDQIGEPRTCPLPWPRADQDCCP